jgi:hypothetical protein
MLILDSIAALNDGRIYLPFYHRGHLSLTSDTAVSIAYFPARNLNPKPALAELIVSPIKFESWRHLTRINARLENRHGILRKLMIAIQKYELDLLYHASGPLENGRILRIELLVDARKYIEEDKTKYLDAPSRERKLLERLEIYLKALLIDHLRFDGYRARLKVRPMEAFRRAVEQYVAIKAKSKQDTSCHPPQVFEGKINGKHLVLPPNLRGILGTSEAKFFITSDSKDRMLRCFILNESTGYTYLRVNHGDSLGSSSRITSLLSEFFVIVTSLSRIKTHHDRSDFELLLYSPLSVQQDDTTRKEQISAILSNEEINDLSVLIGYPSRAGSAASLEEPKPSNIALPEKLKDMPMEEELMRMNNNTILRSRLMSYRESADSNHDYRLESDIDFKISACKEILYKVSEDAEAPGARVFVSYPYVYDDLYAILAAYLKSCGLDVVNGKDIESNSAYRDEIARRIKLSHGFIGIWKLGDQRDTGRISPWLAWELGIASSIANMPIRILPHKSMEEQNQQPYRDLMPEINNPTFLDSGFSGYIQQRLKYFKKDVVDFEKRLLGDGPNQFSRTN